MRITGGELGGRRLAAPPGRATRPTADRVREALFAILGPLAGEEALDLFAGSGALGLEALSRGAARATLIERAPRAAVAIRANVAALELGARARVVVADWRVALARERAQGHLYGVLMVDPPYALLPRIASALGPALAGVAAPGARVVLEHAAGAAGPELPGLAETRRVERRYGDCAVRVLWLAG